jgi:hypothetical protein
MFGDMPLLNVHAIQVVTSLIDDNQYNFFTTLINRFLVLSHLNSLEEHTYLESQNFKADCEANI